MDETDVRRPTLLSPLRTPLFARLYAAETVSVVGDQFGRIALSVLVFDRTGSAGFTALTYALTYLPAIFGGTLLGGLGDRLPRRTVMIGSDVIRAGLFAAIALAGLPLAAVMGLVAVAFFVGPTFTAALVSELADVLGIARFRAASGLRMITAQVAQVGGFALGGVLVAVLDPRGALLIDAVTFVASAVLVGLFGRHSALWSDGAAADVEPAPEPGPVSETVSAAPSLLRDPWLRHLMLLSALAMFFVVPEGLAVPLAHSFGRSSGIAGVLIAAVPLGSAVGAFVLVRLVPRRLGIRVAEPMAVLCGVPLVAAVASPSWPVTFACWAASGALWAYQVDVATAVVRAVPATSRARVVSRAGAVLLGAQGIGLVVFGVLGGWLGARWGVGIAGLAGTLSAGLLMLGSRRAGSAIGSAAQRDRRPLPAP